MKILNIEKNNIMILSVIIMQFSAVVRYLYQYDTKHRQDLEIIDREKMLNSGIATVRKHSLLTGNVAYNYKQIYQKDNTND